MFRGETQAALSTADHQPSSSSLLLSSLELSDTKVYEPEKRARLGTAVFTAEFHRPGRQIPTNKPGLGLLQPTVGDTVGTITLFSIVNFAFRPLDSFRS